MSKKTRVTPVISKESAETAKKTIQHFCAQLDDISFAITYWDGTRDVFGQKNSEFEIILRDASIFKNITVFKDALRPPYKDPGIDFGEAYANGSCQHSCNDLL